MFLERIVRRRFTLSKIGLFIKVMKRELGKLFHWASVFPLVLILSAEGSHNPLYDTQ